MAQFNSKKHGRRIYNSLRYASIRRLWTPSPYFDETKRIHRVYQQGGGADGWSQLSTDPQRALDAAHTKMVEHYLDGCKAPLVASGRINEDGTAARSCNGCGGRWRGIKDPSQVTQNTALLFGIRKDRRGNFHYEGDKCSGSHYGDGFSSIRNAPTAAQWADLPVNIPGLPKTLKVMHLLANAHSLEIGKTRDGESIVPGRIEDPRTGESSNHSALIAISHAALGNAMGMKRLVEDGNTDPNAYFRIMMDSAHRHYGVKNKEIYKDHPNPEGYVGIREGAPIRPFLHTVTDETFRNIRNTLGTQGLDLDRIDPGDHDLKKHWWDMMERAETVQSFTPHHAFDEHLNPLNHVIDTQHASAAARSKEEGVKESYFAAYPGIMPGGASPTEEPRKMEELGSRAKRDPHSVFMASDDLHTLIRSMVQNHKAVMDLRNPVLEREVPNITEAPLDLAMIRKNYLE